MPESNVAAPAAYSNTCLLHRFFVCVAAPVLNSCDDYFKTKRVNTAGIYQRVCSSRLMVVAITQIL